MKLPESSTVIPDRDAAYRCRMIVRETGEQRLIGVVRVLKYTSQSEKVVAVYCHCLIDAMNPGPENEHPLVPDTTCVRQRRNYTCPANEPPF